MVAIGGTDSIDIAADSDSTMHRIVVVHIEADTNSNTDWVGTMWDDMMFALVHPEFSPHSSSNMCRMSFPPCPTDLQNL